MSLVISQSQPLTLDCKRWAFIKTFSTLPLSQQPVIQRNRKTLFLSEGHIRTKIKYTKNKGRETQLFSESYTRYRYHEPTLSQSSSTLMVSLKRGRSIRCVQCPSVGQLTFPWFFPRGQIKSCLVSAVLMRQIQWAKNGIVDKTNKPCFDRFLLKRAEMQKRYNLK